MKLEPFGSNWKHPKHPPAMSFSEMVEESGLTPAQLRGRLRAEDAPKKAFVKRSTSGQNKWYVAKEAKEWLKLIKKEQE